MGGLAEAVGYIQPETSFNWIKNSSAIRHVCRGAAQLLLLKSCTVIISIRGVVSIVVVHGFTSPPPPPERGMTPEKITQEQSAEPTIGRLNRVGW